MSYFAAPDNTVTPRKKRPSMAAAVRAAAHAASRVGACGGVAGHTTPSVVSSQRLAASYSLSLSPNACRRRLQPMLCRRHLASL